MPPAKIGDIIRYSANVIKVIDDCSQHLGELGFLQLQVLGENIPKIWSEQKQFFVENTAGLTGLPVYKTKTLANILDLLWRHDGPDKKYVTTMLR